MTGIQQTFSPRHKWRVAADSLCRAARIIALSCGPAACVPAACVLAASSLVGPGPVLAAGAAGPEFCPAAPGDHGRVEGPARNQAREQARDQVTDLAVQASDRGEAVVIAGLDGWRTLVTGNGTLLTPAGIADFGTLEPHSADVMTAASQALTEALNGALTGAAGDQIRIRYLGAKADRRGRRPVLIYTKAEMIQARLIRSGVAIAFPTGGALPCAAELLAAEDTARRAGRGFWKRNHDWIADASPERFAGRLNRFVIMSARVISVGTRANRTYLNFGGKWADDVTVEVPGRARDRFGGNGALEALKGRKLRIRGFVIEKSGPMIEVRHPWQIEVLTKSLR